MSKDNKASGFTNPRALIRNIVDNINDDKPEELDLSKMNFRQHKEEDIKNLFQAVADSNSLIRLNFGDSIKSHVTLESLMPYLKKNQSISEVNLAGSSIFPKEDFLIDLLANDDGRNIKSLNIAGSRFRSDKLSKILESNYHLTEFECDKLEYKVAEGQYESKPVDKDSGEKISQFLERNCLIELARFYVVQNEAKLPDVLKGIVMEYDGASNGAQKFFKEKGEDYVKQQLESKEFKSALKKIGIKPSSIVQTPSISEKDCCIIL